MIVLNDMIEGRKNNFDFIRFIATIMVMYSHAWPLSGTICDNKLFPKGYDLGKIAVMLFFIISGFLISQSFDRCKTKYDYIKSRSLRIFPGLVVVIFILTFVVGPVCTTLSLKEYFSSTDTYLYLLNSIWCIRWTLPGVFESNSFPSVNGSIWTIPLEIICYILVLVIGRNYLKKSIFIVTSLILVILKENKIFNDTSLLGLSIYSIINMVFMFSVGMWIYCQRNIIVLNMKFAIAAFFLLVYVLYCLPNNLVISSVLIGYLCMYIAFNKKIHLNNFSRHGDLSYGLYIYAFPVQEIVVYCFGGKMNPYINFIISLPITVGLSILSWNFIEKPCLKLKNKR